jgi:hypothetical protein
MADLLQTVTDVVGLYDPAFAAGPQIIDLPSIDGASAPSGITLRTATEQADIDAGAEVTAELRSSTGVLLSDLADLVSVEWQDTHNDVGIGTLVLNRHDAAVAQVAVGCQVYCYLYGQHCFTFLVESPPTTTVYDPGDEAAETVTVSGPGRNVLAEDALIYPPKGVDDPLNPAHRLYSFTSVDYVEGGGWVNAVQQYRADQLDPYRRVLVEWTYQSAGPEPDTVEYVETPPPLGFPDPLAWWIWGSVDRTALGFNFFRTTFTVPTESSVTFAVTGDNYHTLYLDGTAILGDTTELSCWRRYKTAEIKLAAGTYTLAAVVENAPLEVDLPSIWNPAGLLCSVYTTDVSGEVLTVLCRSDSSWRALPYPSTWPGWTPGQILIDIIDEAQARGEIPDLVYDFTASSDSAGNSWPYTQGFSMPVGSNLLEALNSLVEQGWLDYRLAPGGLVLQAFNADWSPNSGVTLAVTGDPATTNLESLEITPQTKPKTRLFVKWSSGNFQLDDAAAQATYGVKPMYVTIDAATLTEAQRRAQVILDNVKAPQDAIVASIAPVGTADRPYNGYLVGDKLTVPDRAGNPTLEKLLSLSISHDENGRAVIGAEFQTRIFKRERENEELLQQLGSGTSGSDKVRWSLYQTEPLNS